MKPLYIVDDEPELLDLLTETASLAGIPAQGFTQASQFFDSTGDFHQASILVLDLHMPEMDGIEVMRKLAQQETPPALILISGHDTGVLHSAEKLGKAQKLSILASLSKPVDLDAFRELLEQHIHSRTDRSQPGIRQTKIFSDSDLYQTIQDSRLLLHYQPQVAIASGEIIGAEALVRCDHPQLGMLYPDQFIPAAEANGWLGELTHRIIDLAVKQEQAWQEQGLSISISVNISANDITSLMLPEQLTELLNDNRLDPTRLNLEITESALMGELVTSLDILTRLRLKGIGLSIDDFGTGYSSLSLLHRVPFTEMKIDRSFVANMTNDPEARAIVKTCILLGHELNMLVVAEGVEDTATWNLLREYGCDVAQGYLLSKPMASDDFMQWSKNNPASLVAKPMHQT